METSQLPAFNIANISFDTFLTIVFLLLVVFFMVHSAIVAYHWITYSSHRSTAFLGTLVHIGVGAVLLLAMGAIIVF